MLDIEWLEEEFVDAFYGAGLLVAAAVVLTAIGIAIGWVVWA